MALDHQYTRHEPRISERHFEGYYDLYGEWVDEHTYVIDGYRDCRIVGERRGSDLYVFIGTCDVTDLLDTDVTDHADAVRWCRKQLGETPKAVTV